MHKACARTHLSTPVLNTQCPVFTTDTHPTKSTHTQWSIFTFTRVHVHKSSLHLQHTNTHSAHIYTHIHTSSSPLLLFNLLICCVLFMASPKMLIKAKCHSQLLYLNLFLSPSFPTSITPPSHCSLSKPLCIYFSTRYPSPHHVSFSLTLLTWLRIVAFTLSSFHLSPIFTPSPANLISHLHYSTLPPGDPGLSSFPLLLATSLAGPHF